MQIPAMGAAAPRARSLGWKGMTCLITILTLIAILVGLQLLHCARAQPLIREVGDKKKLALPKESKRAYFTRKLLVEFSAGGDNRSTNRVGGRCSKDDIVIFQGPTSPLPNGIPTYTVQILNVCISGACRISNIHVNCGWFSSASQINPRVFRRICFNDCIVNDGGTMGPGQSLSFQYANTRSYPLSVSSVSCH